MDLRRASGLAEGERAVSRKLLVVNADDLGADLARNRGIFAAVDAGIITSVSLLPNGPGLGDALDGIRARRGTRVSVGIHLNLSEGAPLGRGLEHLVGADGRFLGKLAAHTLLAEPADPVLRQEIESELERQVQFLQGAGLCLDHLDGHQHVHVFPAAIEAAFEVAERHRIPWVRIPDERTPAAGAAEEAACFVRYGATARRAARGRAFRVPQRFLGLSWKGDLPLPELARALRDLPTGLTELMVHPGTAASPEDGGPFHAFSTTARAAELGVLLDPAFREMIDSSDVHLTSFPD
jgi:predicted glycoside hydrolase/deacetylase ChbG (UPF0249 family)